jgi:hypothetical protein
MRRSVAVACFMILVPALLCAAPTDGDDDEARRHREKDGGFSFVPPADRRAQNITGLKYKVVGAVRERFACNINVVDEPFQGTVDEYVKANISALKERLAKFKVHEQGEFKTTSGLRGVRLVTESEQGRRLLRQTFYFFGTPDAKYVVTCSTLAEGGEKLDSVLEKAMKTFWLERQ